MKYVLVVTIFMAVNPSMHPSPDPRWHQLVEGTHLFDREDDCLAVAKDVSALMVRLNELGQRPFDTFAYSCTPAQGK